MSTPFEQRRLKTTSLSSSSSRKRKTDNWGATTDHGRASFIKATHSNGLKDAPDVQRPEHKEARVVQRCVNQARRDCKK